MSGESFEVLTESELDALYRSSGDDCDMASVKCVVRELRRLRASALTAPEREALVWLTDAIRREIANFTPNRFATPKGEFALAALTKLTQEPR